MDAYSRQTLVCDIGTGYLKCGRSGMETPLSVVPTVVGRPLIKPKSTYALCSRSNKASKLLYAGKEAIESGEFLHLSHPIEHGIVKHWGDMQYLLEDVFDSASPNYAFQASTDHATNDKRGTKVILTEAPMNPTKNREQLCQIMFEKVGFNSLHISTQAVLSLYARGMMSGVVVDVGDGVTHIIPVYEGSILTHLAQRLDIAGRDVTEHLAKLLFVHGYPIDAQGEFSLLQHLKENYCYVASDPSKESKLATETTVLIKRHVTSNGRCIRLGEERFQAPEILFQPEICKDTEAKGISDSVYNIINQANVDLRSEFYRSIVLSGGTTLLNGFGARISKDLKKFYKQKVLQSRDSTDKIKIKVHSTQGREFSVFTGAAVLADIMKDRDDFWLTRSQWEAEGPAVIHKFANMKM